MERAPSPPAFWSYESKGMAKTMIFPFTIRIHMFYYFFLFDSFTVSSKTI